MYFESDAVQRLVDIVRIYRAEFNNRFYKLLYPVVGGFIPPTLDSYLKELDRLYKRLEEAQQGLARHEDVEIADAFSSVLRDAVISARLRLAEHVEVRRANAIHPDLLARLDAEMLPFDAFLREGWFVQAKPKPVPQLADFFPIQHVEALLADEIGQERVREYDEKFHILQAPGLFIDDLGRARRAGAIRGLLVAAAFVDIDHFKEFNSERGNTHVDRHMLPKFMRFVEAHVYKRGYAYRQGGDEYLVLLNNVTEDEALASMDRLRQGVADLSYEGLKRSATISVGVVIVHPDCPLTGREIEHAAERAKEFAKKQGRNRVATYNSPLLQDGDLRITAPVV